VGNMPLLYKLNNHEVIEVNLIMNIMFDMALDYFNDGLNAFEV
jgi:hypothetical protein